MKKKPVPKKKPVKKKKVKKLSCSSPKSTAKEKSSQSELFAGIPKDQLILALTLQTSALELAKNEYIEMAPFAGMCGPFRLSGNSLPVVEYRVFEQTLMEFIKIRVEIAKPDRIQFLASIDCRGKKGEHTDAARHGQEIPMKDKYGEHFEKLAAHLFRYFPYYRNSYLDRDPNRGDKVQIKVDSGEPLGMRPEGQ